MGALHMGDVKRTIELHLAASMTREPAKNVSADEELWRETLTRGHAGLRGLRRVMRLLPGTPRCKICNNPFGGIGGRVCRVVGFTPSRKSPHLCPFAVKRCLWEASRSKPPYCLPTFVVQRLLLSSLGPYAEALNRFYQAATDVLVRCDATIDKLIGDEVMAFFVPAFAGRDFKQRAVEAGQALLLRLGYANNREAWLPVGVGIDAGVAFVGNVGGTDYVDFTVVGDHGQCEVSEIRKQDAHRLVEARPHFPAAFELLGNCCRQNVE